MPLGATDLRGPLRDSREDCTLRSWWSAHASEGQKQPGREPNSESEGRTNESEVARLLVVVLRFLDVVTHP